MMTRLSSGKTIIALGCLSLAAVVLTTCGYREPLPLITWEGEVLRYGTNHDELPCLGTLTTLDRTAIQLESLLNQPLPEGEKITYYWLEDELYFDFCPRHSVGCTYGSYIFSLKPDHVHELVHALLPREERHVFLEEGLAVCFSHGIYSGVVDWEQSIGQSRNELMSYMEPWVTSEEIDYPLVGLFACFLVEKHGVNSVKEVRMDSKLTWGPSDFDGAFQSILGVSLDDSLDEFLHGKDWCFSDPPVGAFDPIPWSSADLWLHEVTMSCESGEATGPGSVVLSDGVTFQSLRASIPLEIGAAGLYRMCIESTNATECLPWLAPEQFTEESDFLSASLEKPSIPYGPACDPSDWIHSVAPGSWLMPGVDTVFDLDSGSYMLKLTAIGDDVWTIHDEVIISLGPCVNGSDPIPGECEETQGIECDQCRVCFYKSDQSGVGCYFCECVESEYTPL